MIADELCSPITNDEDIYLIDKKSPRRFFMKCYDIIPSMVLTIMASVGRTTKISTWLRFQ